MNIYPKKEKIMLAFSTRERKKYVEVKCYHEKILAQERHYYSYNIVPNCRLLKIRARRTNYITTTISGYKNESRIRNPPAKCGLSKSESRKAIELLGNPGKYIIFEINYFES